MAERNFDKVETLGRKKRMVCGSFKPNGSSAIDTTQNVGTGWTVAYTTTGVYTVTFTDKYGGRCSAKASLIQATRTQTVEVASCSATGGTMVIHGFAVGSTTLADITAATATFIDFEVIFDDQANL